jgi:hypothetical protein
MGDRLRAATVGDGVGFSRIVETTYLGLRQRYRDGDARRPS